MIFLSGVSPSEIDFKISNFQALFAHNFLSNGRRQFWRPDLQSAHFFLLNYLIFSQIEGPF